MGTVTFCSIFVNPSVGQACVAATLQSTIGYRKPSVNHIQLAYGWLTFW